MKIKYEFVTGAKEIEVDESTGNIIKDLNRQEYNNQKRETRRHCTIEKSLEFGTMPDDTDLERDFICREEMKTLYAALNTLTADQKDLVNRVFFNGQSLTAIAKEKELSIVAIHKRLKKIFEILRKRF